MDGATMTLSPIELNIFHTAFLDIFASESFWFGNTVSYFHIEKMVFVIGESNDCFHDWFVLVSTR